MNRQVGSLYLAAACSVTVMSAMSAVAVAAPVGRLTPPPGAYDVEVTSDGYTLAGMGQRNVCIAPLQSIEMPRELVADGCTLTKGQVLSGEVLMQLACPWNRTTTRTRQVGADKWETTVEKITHRGPPGASLAASMAQMRYMAQQIVTSGHPDERAEARAFLANAAKLETRLKSATPPPLSDKTIERMAAKEGVRSKLVRSMTRVGDCKG